MVLTGFLKIINVMSETILSDLIVPYLAIKSLLQTLGTLFKTDLKLWNN